MIQYQTISAGMTWFNRYLEMDLATILAETPSNFCIRKSDILSFDMWGPHGVEPTDSQTPLACFKKNIYWAEIMTLLSLKF